MHTITRDEYENRIEWGVVLYHANGGNTVARFNDLNTALLFCRYLNGGTIERWPYELLPITIIEKGEMEVEQND